LGSPLFLQMEDVLNESKIYENPLVPNTKLRQMYMAMAEARALDEHIAKMQRRVKGRRRVESTHGQEACRVSTAIDLGPGDLVSDSQTGVVMELIAGAKASSLLARVREIHSGKKTKGAKLGGTSGRLLPRIDDAGERLRLAMGAALSFKTLSRPNVVVAYVRCGDVAKEVWRQVLEMASKLELPVIFVVLPAMKGEKSRGLTNLSAKASQWGVPGIPADADDAVALYRVAQESLGRTRGGDGPVLIECVSYRIEASARGNGVDPLVQMKEFLAVRKVGTKAWLEAAGDGFRRRITQAGQ
jgi:acetoin:2,6-dichlorophenolindophenol oxidoreductase subunit alpha